MHQTDHISDEQLNEYLDHETNNRARIEAHLASCVDCARRLRALQGLFDEIESLPDLALSSEFSFGSAPNVSAKLPRSLRLTLVLQAAIAAVVLIVASPFVLQFISPYMSFSSAFSLADLFMQLQTQWRTWLDVLSTLRSPTLPELPVVQLSSLFMMFTVLGVSLLWLIGNGLLLRNQMK